MNQNVGQIDSLLRIVIGAGLLAWAFFSSHPLHWWGLIGLVPLATALLRFCPLYALLGVRTCPKSPPAVNGGR